VTNWDNETREKKIKSKNVVEDRQNVKEKLWSQIG
jgi:hypothetical protein